MNLKTFFLVHFKFRILSLALLLITASGNMLHSQTTPYTSWLVDEDVKLQVVSGSASSTQSGYEISRSWDGNKSTIYHSTWGSTTFPVTLIYNFSGAVNLDYIMYSTRTDASSNGNFRLVDIEVRTAGQTVYQKKLTVDLKGVAGTHKIVFDTTQVGINSVRFIVRSGAGDSGGFAACSEMEFYTRKEGAFNPSQIFTDASCSAIKPGLNRTQLEAISNPYYRQLALDIFDNAYSSEFRVQQYKAWPHPDVFSQNNRVGTYSLCDNPTGIFIRSGDTVIVFVDDTRGQVLSLTLKNLKATDANGYWANTYYPLSTGLNRVVADRDGLFYVFYHTHEHLTAPEIKIHFAYAKVNGYYDSQKHSAADWSRILNISTYEYFDVLGQYAHLSFPKASFKANAATTGPQLIAAYDDLVFMQREMMGYFRYPNRNPYNRSHFVVMYHSYMYSTSYHTGYHIDTMNGLTSVTNVKKYPWGPAHEVGHSNQHNPLFKWIGMTEVTNNVQSLYVQTKWGNVSRLTDEGRYQQGFNDILIGQIAYSQADIWRKLVPLWQLQLFFANVLGRDNFYQGIYEGARTRPTGSSHGEYQLNFVRLLTDSSRVDLTEFLDVWGFLKPVSVTIEDYSTATLTITQPQATTVRNYIKGKNFPVLPYKIQYITDTNWPLYKNKAQVITGKASQFGGNFKLSGWSNVVAYEGWQGDKLVAISQTESLSVPGVIDENTKVYAVQYDGTKFEVIPAVKVMVASPEISTEVNEKWFVVKNMSNELSNSGNSVGPRSITVMNATGAGAAVRGVFATFFKAQRWKLVDVNGKTGLVNQAGLYLAENMTSTTEPFGWTLEAVNQGGSAGYRFASYNTSGTLTAVAHLSNQLSLMNYTGDDAASVWQFIPDDAVKISDASNAYFYKLGSLRYETDLIGSSLKVNEGEIAVKITQLGTESAKWKFTDYNASTGSCYVMNENGQYLTISGTSFVLSETPRLFYLYLSTLEGVAGYRISTGVLHSSVMLNLTNVGNLGYSSSYNIGVLWYPVPVNLTNVDVVTDFNTKVFVENRKIFVEGAENFEVFNISGQKVWNENLNPGIYLVKQDAFSTKVIVR